jgi:hypothetical protein
MRRIIHAGAAALLATALEYCPHDSENKVYTAYYHQTMKLFLASTVLAKG